MKKTILLLLTACMCTAVHAQLETPTPGIKMLPDGGCVRGVAGETVGITDVMVNYGRPAVRGREGKIWGGVVEEGFFKNPFGNTATMPWRAGANENTTIDFSTDVMIEGQPLKAGKYGLHIAYHPDESIVIFSRSNESWGSYYYDEADDALRVKVKPVKQDHLTERLSYVFSDQTDSSAVLSVVWEKLAIPFTISTELTKLQLASIEKVMNGVRSFDFTTYRQAAEFYYSHDIEMDKALSYAGVAASQFRSFYYGYLQYKILVKMDRQSQADSVIDDAIAHATEQERRRYGRVLLRDKVYNKALVLLQQSYADNPADYTTSMDIARSYSGMGRYRDAIKYTNKAKKKTADADVQKKLDAMLADLKQGKDINV